MVADTGLRAEPARSTRARPCCSRPARRRCSTSTTAPTRSSRPRARRPAGACTGSGIPPTRDRPGHRDPQGLHDPGRRGAVPDRAARRQGRVPAQDRRRVRHDDRPPAPLRLARHRRRPLRHPDQRRHRLRHHQARRPDRPGQVPVCVAYDVDGVRHDEMPMNQTDFHHAKPIYEELPGWWEDISACRTFEELPANAQAYVAARRGAHRRPRSRRSASAPAATRSSSGTRSSRPRLTRHPHPTRPACDSLGSRRNTHDDARSRDWVTRLADEVIAEAQRRGARRDRSSARRASAPPGRSTWATCARS